MDNFGQKKKCYFCKMRVKEIDYKDTATLGKYLNRWSKIDPGSRSGACAKHQRQLSAAIKRARELALLPYISR
ncbi:MAG: 30S ribosomal protein S18 [Candidatus Berkelbacteria bacterium]|nr:30S ribosomal protein S18 [Candidatus Berkelbacteria bacterium]